MSTATTPRHLHSPRLFSSLSRKSNPSAHSSHHGHPSSLLNGEGGEGGGEWEGRGALEEMAEDEMLGKFLEPEFNATAFASQALGSGTALASSKKLGEGIERLQQALHSEVVNRHDELLQQLSSLKDTESVLAIVRAGVDGLNASVERVRAELADPYRQVKLKTRQLAALHGTTELLRSAIKLLKLVKKLREQMSVESDKIDLAKAAALFFEIQSLWREGDLRGVEVVEGELEWVGEAGQRIRAAAMRSLEIGMEGMNQAEVASTLQVYFNMGELRSTVEVLLAKYKVAATRAVASALDMKAISAAAGPSAMGSGGFGSMPGGASRSGTPQLGAGSKAKELLWQRLVAGLEQLNDIVMAAWHLQRVLAKKRDPLSHVIFLDEVVQSGDMLPVEKIWDAITRSLTNQLRAAFNTSSFVKEAFVTGLPKLTALIDSFLDRLARATEVKGIPPAVKPQQREDLLAALEPFQNAYLAHSLTLLTDSINQMLPAGIRASIPSSEQAARLIQLLAGEVEAVRGDARLTSLVLRNVAKALRLLAERCEYQVATGPEARQVSGPATAAELRNLSLCVFLEEVYGRVGEVIEGAEAAWGEEFGDEVRQAVGLAVVAIHGVALEAVSPIFKAMTDTVESILLRMHDQSFGADDSQLAGGGGSLSSAFMADTAAALGHFKAEFLSRLQEPSAAKPTGGAGGGVGLVGVLGRGKGRGDGKETVWVTLTKRLASRILLFFVRHAALLRSLSESGKLRLARDMGELEFAIGQSLFPVERLGQPYRALRAFRPLIFLETSEIPSSALLQDLPPSVTLHHLFSRAPSDLESPMKRIQLTPMKYSLWLDQHTEEDACRGIKAALDAYAQKVRTRGDKEFSSLYPLMVSLVQSLSEKARSGN